MEAMKRQRVRGCGWAAQSGRLCNTLALGQCVGTDGERSSPLALPVPDTVCPCGQQRGYSWQPQTLLHPTINLCLLIREVTGLCKHFHLLLIKSREKKLCL